MSATQRVQTTPQLNRYTEYQNILKELKLSFVKKGTKEYDTVMNLLNMRCPMKEVNLEWQQACKKYGLSFVRKGTPTYEHVLKEYKRIKELNSPILQEPLVA